MDRVRMGPAQAFERKVLRNGRPALIAFTDPGSPATEALMPELQKLAGRYAGRLDVGTVDIWSGPELLASMRLPAVPALTLYRPDAPSRTVRAIGTAKELEQALELEAVLGLQGGAAYRLGRVLGAVVVGVGVIVFVFSVLGSGGAQLTNDAPHAASETACEAAFRDASDGRVDGALAYDLDPAIIACRSLAEWFDASRQYPTALDGADPRMVAENRCRTGRFPSAAICRELGLR